MEILISNDYYILVNDESSLWCSRIDGSFTPRDVSTTHDLKDCVCIGIVFGFIGRFTVQNDIDKRLVLIRERAIVGCLPGGHEVYKIQKIAVLPLSQLHLPEVEFEVCKKHRFNPIKLDKAPNSSDMQQKAFQKAWNSLKSASSQVKVKKQPKELRNREKLEKRIIEEFIKMFTDTDSFYYSFTGDLTNTIQRQYQNTDTQAYPLWKKIDERFFWNKHMTSELISANNPLADQWIIPIIQGFVQIEQCWIDLIDDRESLSSDTCRLFQPPPNFVDSPGKSYTMTLISRRSRHRAGTRYKRRGVDELGKCANYVETEQIFEYSSHIVSFVQLRGSVPIFWSQPGYKYRPPPQLDKGQEETQVAFERHFEEELSIYDSQVIINLMEQTGKEKIINDAYLDCILKFSCPKLTYVTFDFHEYCRGMRFENVSVLIDNIQDILKDMRYCWKDSEGLICSQQGIFRVNCVDCLDRTNIVQTALARSVMDIQFNKLGLLPPEGVLPAGCRRVFQMLWANNGDIISRQYSGTVALKGDFTRTGERRIAGMMKDGYHSANRYYVNRFKDAFRQATIDLVVGSPITDDIDAATPEREEADQEHHERVKQLIEDCKKILIPEVEVVLGGWALVDADPTTGDPNKQDMDTILVLTKSSYYIAEYDDQTDRIIKYQKVLLEDLERIELGQEPGVFKTKHCCLRLHYTVNGQSGYFHMFRSTNTRFFNNMAVPILSEEEAAESLKAICETFKVSLGVKELSVPLFEGKLERRKSKVPLSGSFRRDQRSAFHLDIPSFSSMPRNISEGQLNSLKSVGSRALSNVTSHFARLQALGKRSGDASLAAVAESFNPKSPNFSTESSSDSEGEPGPAHSDGSEVSDGDESALPDDAVLQSCGILIGLQSGNYDTEAMRKRRRSRLAMPQIHISTESNLAAYVKPEDVALGQVSRQFSKSSEDLDFRAVTISHEVSHLLVQEETHLDTGTRMKTSHSESAIRDFSLQLGAALSPLAIKKDLVLSPLSRIARGVQSFGLHLRPTVDRPRPRIRSNNCATRIIEL